MPQANSPTDRICNGSCNTHEGIFIYNKLSNVVSRLGEGIFIYTSTIRILTAIDYGDL